MLRKSSHTSSARTNSLRNWHRQDEFIDAMFLKPGRVYRRKQSRLFRKQLCLFGKRRSLCSRRVDNRVSGYPKYGGQKGGCVFPPTLFRAPQNKLPVTRLPGIPTQQSYNKLPVNDCCNPLYSSNSNLRKNNTPIH